jgi:hypothetical protein
VLYFPGRSSLEASLDAQVSTFRRSVYATNTQICYRSHRSAYLAFCAKLGYAPIPATTKTICRYVAMLARTLKYSSIRQYINIIRILHLEWGLSNPLENNVQLSNVLKGVRRQLGDTVNRKLPITPQILRQILSFLHLDKLTDASVWAACLVSFYGLLRRSNVMPASPKSVSASKCILREDFTFHEWGIKIVLRHSKTVQFRQHIWDIPLPRLHNHPLCPVQAIFRAFELSPRAPGQGTAFVVLRDTGNWPLTVNMFIARLRECLHMAGLDPARYAGHSLRRGGASFCYQIGLSAESIRLLGDWKSDCFFQYIENSSTTRYNIISTMQKHV